MDRFNELAGLTIPALLRRRAGPLRFKLALSAPSYRGYRDRLTYAQLVHRMTAMGQALRARDVNAGDRVALFLANTVVREGVLTALGCWEVGAIVAPLNVRASDDELAFALELIAPAVIVAEDADAARLRRLAPAARLWCLGGGEDVLAGAERWPDPQDGVAGAAAASSATPSDCAVALKAVALPDPEAPSVLLFTSGTTARAKAVVHTQRSQLHAGLAVGGAIGLTDADTYQGAWPLFTSSVLNMACLSSWVYGAGVVLEENTLDNAARLRLIAAEATSVYHGVTSPLHFMIDEYARGGYDLTCLRRLGYGGAVMPVEVIEKFRRHLPWVDQVHIWGMTETGPAGTFLPSWFLPRKAGCIGQAMPGCAVRIVDDVTGVPVPCGATGEIAFAGPSAALGYYRNPQATAQTFVDGWVRTGDIGRIDDEGHLHFVDRKKDIINRGGLKVASAAVEEVLYRDPQLKEAAVIAVAHPGLGEDVAACVVARDGAQLDLQALAQRCADHLADYACPRQWFVLPALPKNPMGKILKRELRDMIATQTPQRIDVAPRRSGTT
ncbi:class I adenylate-forming enzyme family protein [Schauerella aestuarii]|uniref:class I adenylate-forming enzyme family protein n=1 Tax=Schauerella aestuarii TaxID=2511204 RepID=UPI00136A96F7|nr:class I adenylate-forming enzyme family protein [Achromobacter aestuarii]MYZ42791.1 long-chain fatty acid--CoA ligase [Achromobacter aestuarii]